MIKEIYNENKIIELWKGFEDIPVDINNEIIEDNYFIWNKGTLISEVWSWFNKNYSEGLQELWEVAEFTE